jgi:hypothetical protein
MKIFSLSKKGLSVVIATIAIVLLTVVAVGIIASIVIPLVRENLTGSTACVPYQDYFFFEEEFGYNCYITNGNEKWHGISVGSGNVDGEKEGKIIGLDLFFVMSGQSKKVSVRDGDMNSNLIEGIRMVDTGVDPKIEIPKSGEVRTYVYISDNILYESVDIAPVLEGGRVCDKSDSIRVIACEPEKEFGS